MIKIEDILFWILIITIIAIVLWLLSGSPPETDALIAIGLFVIASESLIWKKLFTLDNKIEIGLLKLDNKTSLSFMNLKNEIDKNNLMINNRFDNIENKLNMLIKRK